MKEKGVRPVDDYENENADSDSGKRKAGKRKAPSDGNVSKRTKPSTDAKVKKEKAVKSQKKEAAVPLFGPRPDSEKSNPFFQLVDQTPEAIKHSMTKDAWMNALGGLKTRALQFKVATISISAHFEKKQRKQREKCMKRQANILSDIFDLFCFFLCP